MSSADQPVASLLLALTITAAAAAQEPETVQATPEDAPSAVEEPAPDAAETVEEEPADTDPPPPPDATTFSFAVEDESGPWTGGKVGPAPWKARSKSNTLCRADSGSGSATTRSPANGRCTTTRTNASKPRGRLS